MAIEIRGIDNLLKRLNKLSNLETKETVLEVAKDMQEAIQNKASSFSENADEIKAFEPRTYGNGSTYIDVGLKNGDSDWEKIKGLYFQNYGFNDYGWNFKGQYYITNHLMWFNEAVQSAENDCKSKLKVKLKQEIQKCWNE
ncbi:hypothetical protein [Clostridium saccharoperbutylacetonicum]|uniref:hypothetical protein n=1 Tax=Clostridium saccharoperbutylacetonicum TaxID=36745 RepID=UPI0039E7CCDD